MSGTGFLVGLGVGAASLERSAPRASLPGMPAVIPAAVVLPPPMPSPPAMGPAPTSPPATTTPRPAAPRVAPAEIEVRRGDTLLGILTRAGIGPGEAHDAVSSLRRVANLRRLRTGQRLALEIDAAGAAGQRLARLVWPLDGARELHLVRDHEGGFAARSIERPLTREPFRVHGRIAGSLYESARRAGMSGASLAEMIALLSWDLDLQREVQPGDRFEAVVERRLTEEGQVVGSSAVLFVGFESRERKIAAYRFVAPDGRADFYDREGHALRKWLLRTPVDGARLSSAFGPRRHPVLGYTRMHKGVDFAAPTGTPVIAAGDGTVAFAGRNRGYGNHVRLTHGADYGTAYAHLSRIAPGIKPGRKVRQGELIGQVGSTGLSTGPHLHYEVLHRDEPIDPVGVKASFAAELKGSALRRFLAQRDTVDALRRQPDPDRERLVADRGG